MGWYHTHLFRATDDEGLSTVDVQMHHTTFKRPWQVAGLLNIGLSSGAEERVLRFYVGHGRSMAPCPVEVLA